MARYAAVDLGSHSLRLLIADVDRHGHRTRLHEDREAVRLGTGVFRDGRIGNTAIDNALQALERMAVAIRTHRVSDVRAVGTAALRDAADQARFVRHASAILGVPLEVIDGVEEARLVHRGVSESFPHEDERLVVVDLGGGSAQLVLSDHGMPVEAVSLPIGAVRLTEYFGCADRPDADLLEALRRHVRDAARPVIDRWLPGEIDRVVATSGTARTVISVVHNLDRSERSRADRLTASPREMGGVLDALIGSTVEERQCITGVGRKRAAVLPAGLAVLYEIVSGLGVPAFHYSSAGIVDGIIRDLSESTTAAPHAAALAG